MAKRVLALMLAVLTVFVFGSFSEMTGAESRHGGGHRGGGYSGGHSGGHVRSPSGRGHIGTGRNYSGGGHQGYHGGSYRSYRTYYGNYQGYYGGCLSWEPFWGGSAYYMPGYYSYPVPAPQDIPSRRCQILEDGEWKDIPCR